MAVIAEKVERRVSATKRRCSYYKVYCSLEKVVVVAPGRYWNLILREVHDEVYGAPGRDDRVWFVLARGADVGSRSVALPAVRVGYWPGDEVLWR